MFDIQVFLSCILTAFLIFRCFWVCRERRAPPRLYRVLRDEHDGSVEQIVVAASTCRRSQRPDTETPPPLPRWEFDNVRPPRAPGSFMGPAVHSATRAPVNSADGPPPPYSCAANSVPVRDEPPPTYQQVVDQQQQENANRTADT